MDCVGCEPWHHLLGAVQPGRKPQASLGITIEVKNHRRSYLWLQGIDDLMNFINSVARNQERFDA